MGLTILPAGTGDVTGPNGASNGHVAVFSGVTGKIIADGGAITGGTVTSTSVTTANGYSGTVATATTTPAITIVPLGIPQNSKSAAYILALTDNCYQIFHPSTDTNNRQFTIPKNATVAFPLGAVVTFTNDSANSITVVIDTDTLRYVNVGAVTTITVPTDNMLTINKTTTTSWLASGTAGVTTA